MSTLAGVWGGFATNVGGAIARGTVAGMANNTYQQLTNEKSCFDWSDVLDNGLGGALGAGLGGGAVNIGSSILRSPIQREIGRFIPGAFPNGATYGTAGAIAGAALGEGVASSSANSIDQKTDRWGFDTTINYSTIINLF
jgi:hypothetical protein